MLVFFYTIEEIITDFIGTNHQTMPQIEALTAESPQHQTDTAALQYHQYYIGDKKDHQLPTGEIHQFEKEEALDFVNNPEQYKDKREKKEKFLDYQAGKVDVGNRQTQINLQNTRPNSAGMQFIKGEDGKIKIQGVQ